MTWFHEACIINHYSICAEVGKWGCQAPVSLSNYIFSIKLLHAHLQYAFKISVNCWKGPMKVLKVDFTKYALSITTEYVQRSDIGKIRTSHQLVQFFFLSIKLLHARVAQSVGHPTRKSGVLGSIPGLATYFRFSFRFFKKGSCQLLAKVCARSTG